MVINRDKRAVISSIFPFWKLPTDLFYTAFIILSEELLLKILMLICVCNARALQKTPPNHASTEAWGILEKRNELQSMTLLHSPVRLHL
jgi:hypothetical protein